MTRIAYLDAQAGISGDMALGAFIHTGIPVADLQDALAPLGLPGWSLRAELVSQHGIGGMHVTVVVEGEHPARDWRTIRTLIEDAALAEGAKERALGVFSALAHAEAQVHGVPVDAVHFHEVGAVDSIVDIVGVAVVLDLLRIEAVYASPFATGHGWVRSQHGRIPVPAPATLALIAAARAPLVPLDTDRETVTPTGAAIVTSLVRAYTRPPMIVQAVGYGFGTRVMPWPNCLRVWIGEAMPAETATTLAPFSDVSVAESAAAAVAPARPAPDDETLIEANLDDMTAEAMAYALERVFAAGALDAWFTPITMKKSRPAVTLSAICASDDAIAVTDVMLRETSTFGVRAMPIQRTKAARRWETVQTPWGPVRVKVKTVNGDMLDAVPEYEMVAALARAAEVPFRDVYAAAAEAGHRIVYNARGTDY